VISGQQLPKPKASGAKGNTVDPYVTVEVFGIPADCAEERTKTVNNTGMIQRHSLCPDVARSLFYISLQIQFIFTNYVQKNVKYSVYFIVYVSR